MTQNLSRFAAVSTIALVLAISSHSSAEAQWFRRSVKPASITAAATTGNFETEILNLVNIERAKAKLPPLKLSAALSRAAQIHTNDIGLNQFSHTGSDGSKPADRAKRAGYTYSFVGENIAAGSATAAATMNQWMKSPGHRANILKREYTELGVGYAKTQGTYTHYWTQVFGKPR